MFRMRLVSLFVSRLLQEQISRLAPDAAFTARSLHGHPSDHPIPLAWVRQPPILAVPAELVRAWSSALRLRRWNYREVVGVNLQRPDLSALDSEDLVRA